MLLAEGLHKEAYTYLHKPFEPEEMLLNVRRALETTRLRREVHALAEAGHRGPVRLSLEQILGLDPDLLIVPQPYGEVVDHTQAAAAE